MQTVCRIEDLTDGEGLRITEGIPAPIALFRLGDSVYAIDDTCTQQEASLADGWVKDDLVECPLHASSFDLRTGRPTCPPAKTGVRTHRVDVVDGEVCNEAPLSPVSAPSESCARTATTDASP